MLGVQVNPACPRSPINIPIGSLWNEDPPTPLVPLKTKKKAVEVTENFKGDQVLARSIAFMRDTFLSREASIAMADGDVGRLYEVIKVMVFTFAGTTHTNYTAYLLETITKLEMECSDELKKALLHLSLVNLTGRKGRFSAGDYIQEYFNRLLEAVVQRKGVDYGSSFIRNVWSRNLAQIARLKTTWLGGVGLASHAARHTGAKTAAEVRILLDVYRETELHTLRPGRIFDVKLLVDDFTNGFTKLGEGKLKKWIHKTTRSRGLKDQYATAMDIISDSDDEEDSHIHDDESSMEIQPTFAAMEFIDGELIFTAIDMDDEATRIMQIVGEDNGLYSESEDSGSDSTPGSEDSVDSCPEDNN